MKTTLKSLIMAVCLVMLGAATAGAQSGGASGEPWAARVEDSGLRIGDVISISLPGEPSLNKDFQIDRTGQIVLPEVGAIALAGHPVAWARETIKERLALAFRDLDRLAVSLKERRILVHIGGYVKQPGLVDLPGDATVQNAIALAGGLSEGAQLDRLQLKRGSQLIVFDYKKYLESGDAKVLPSLLPLDTIFVPSSPVTGNVFVNFDGRTLAQAGDGADERASIKIFGEVNNPATYTYRPGATIVDMMLRAGGVTRFAATEQIRILSQGSPILFNLRRYLDSGDAKDMPALLPGATIFVPKQTEEIRTGASTVYVMGEVAKPGAFDTQPNASFIEILANSGGPTRFADTRHIRVIKAGGGVELADLVAFTENPAKKLPAVQAGDAIFVPEKTETNEPSWLKVHPNRAVQVLGAVTKPGRYEWSNEMSLFDLLAAAGGPTGKGDIAHIQILDEANGVATPKIFDARTFLVSGGPLDRLPKIRAGYVLMIPELPTDVIDNKTQWIKLPPEEAIYVMGEVGRPGRYSFRPGMSFLDVLTAADGPTQKADLTNIRVSVRRRGVAGVERVNLQRYFLTGDRSLLPRLRIGDVIFIPDQTVEFAEAPKRDAVQVLGAVAKPGKYPFSDYMTILDLLTAAGGPTAGSLQSRILVVNLSGIEKKSSYFNLPKFAKTADTRLLPVLRPGDMVYVPEENQDDLRALADVVKNITGIMSIYPGLKSSSSGG